MLQGEAARGEARPLQRAAEAEARPDARVERGGEVAQPQPRGRAALEQPALGERGGGRLEVGLEREREQRRVGVELLREARYLERAVTRHAGRRATREPAEAARPCSCCCTQAAEGRRAYRSQTSLGRRFFSIESDASAGCRESALPT